MKRTGFGVTIALVLATLLLSGCLDHSAPTLAGSSPAQSSLYVRPVEGLKDDFIRGVDVSSYLAEKESGVVYRDFAGKELTDAGFFKLLADSGVNWVRLRVWNDPADRDGHSYGGGHNDLATAVSLGKLASKAGLKVCVDFHYSDFWADPNKQAAPKEWAHMTMADKADALGVFTADALTKLLDSGVDVQMVQLGNEINNGLAGETKEERIYQLLKAGGAAVRTVSAQKKRTVQIAVHYTNPDGPAFYGYCGKLVDAGVDFDVFAVSYYPYWHGTVTKLTNSLNEIVQRYGKEVMIAETSYPYTPEDGDGFPNTIGEGSAKLRYGVSPQGQANLIHDLAASLVSLDGKGIGLFYWEPAWIPVQVIRKDDPNAPQIYEQNQQLWEKHGSGWAASYAVKYDPEAKGAYGGSAWDNQALFDFDGNPLESLRTFRYLFGGTTAENKLVAVNDIVFESGIGQPVSLPAAVPATLLDDTTRDIPVVWEQSQTDAAQQGGAGEYRINGVATDIDGTTHPLVCTLQIKKINYIKNPGFEDDDMSMWTITGDGVGRLDDNNRRSGDYSLKFYSEKKVSFTAEQAITDIPAGTYRLGAWLEGGDGGGGASFAVYISVNGTEAAASAALTGWQQWSEAVVPEVNIPAGATVLVGARGDADPKAWGAFDDFTLVESDNGGDQTAGGGEQTADSVKQTTGSGEQTADSLKQTAVASLTNGDFEAKWDANNQIPGWSIAFHDWGQGDKKAQYTLKTDAESVNTTQVLNLSNTTGKENPFSITQSFLAPAAGSYVAAVDFEGKSAPRDAYLSVNGQKTKLGSFGGWNHWNQTVSGAVSVKQGEPVTLEVGGLAPGDWWMDVDNVVFVPQNKFTPKVFQEPAKSAPAAPHQRLTNGDFEAKWDANNQIPGWSIAFHDWGQGDKKAQYTLKTDAESVNTTQVLNLSNTTGKENRFSITQSFLAPAAGSYVAAVDFEGKSAPRDAYLSVNGQKTKLGSFGGWNHWNQTVSGAVSVKQGEPVTLEVGGLAPDDWWMDVDNVVFAPDKSFTSRAQAFFPGGSYFPESGGSGPSKPVPPAIVPLPHVQNADFSQGLDWSFEGGYLPGWSLPKEIDWDTWKLDVNHNVFSLSNDSQNQNASAFVLKQPVRLAPGEYTLSAQSPWGGSFAAGRSANDAATANGAATTNDAVLANGAATTGDAATATGDAVLANVSVPAAAAPLRMTVAVVQNGATLCSQAYDAGGGALETPAFTIAAEGPGEIVFTFALPGQTYAGLGDIRLNPYREDSSETLSGFSDISWDKGELYPYGQMGGWALPPIDWSVWDYKTQNNAFQIYNKSGAAASYRLSQSVWLNPGAYYVEGALSSADAGESTVRVEAATVAAEPQTLAGKEQALGDGLLQTDSFTVQTATRVRVSLCFTLAGGHGAAVSRLEIKTGAPPQPVTVRWSGADQVGGADGTAATTGIRLVFDQAMNGLTKNNFWIADSKASVTSLTDNGGGCYTLGISDITVANREQVWVNMTVPEGYQIDGDSWKGVVVYRAAPPFIDPTVNGSFSHYTGDYSYAPDGWKLFVDGTQLTNLQDFSSVVDGTNAGINTNGGFELWTGAGKTFEHGFSLTQTVPPLLPGRYRLCYTITNYVWGLNIGDAGSGTTLNGSGKVPFTVGPGGSYQIKISADKMWNGKSFKITSLSIERAD